MSTRAPRVAILVLTAVLVAALSAACEREETTSPASAGEQGQPQTELAPPTTPPEAPSEAGQSDDPANGDRDGTTTAPTHDALPTRAELLDPPATGEELADAKLLAGRLAELDGDTSALSRLYSESTTLRLAVVLAATTDDEATAVRALTAMREAQRRQVPYGEGEAAVGPRGERMLRPEPLSDDYLRTAVFWTRIDADEVPWHTLTPAVRALLRPGNDRLAVAPAAGRVAELLGHADLEVKLEIAVPLSWVTVHDSPTILEALLRETHGDDPRVVAQVLRVLASAAAGSGDLAGSIGARARALSTHDDHRVRGAAIQAGTYLPEHALTVAELLPSTGDWSPYVRGALIDALKHRASPEAIHVLVDLLDDTVTSDLFLMSPREGGLGISLEVGRHRRLDHAAVDAIAALSGTLQTPFVHGMGPVPTGKELAAAVAAARAWYEAHRETIAPLPAFEPVTYPVEERFDDRVPVDPAVFNRSLAPGTRVYTADPRNLPNRPTAPGFGSGWVVLAGERASLVKVDTALGWVPNALIVPVAGAGDAEAVEIGDVVLASDPHPYGEGVLTIVDLSDDGPLARPAALGGAARALQVLGPGTFHRLSEPLEPGTHASIARTPSRTELVMVVAATDAMLLVRDSHWTLETVARDEVHAFPLRSKVSVGDTVWAPDVTGQVIEQTVSAVDPATGLIQVADEDGRTVELARGTYTTREPPAHEPR